MLVHIIVQSVTEFENGLLFQQLLDDGEFVMFQATVLLLTARCGLSETMLNSIQESGETFFYAYHPIFDFGHFEP